MNPHKFQLIRNTLRMTQDDLASILGVTRAHINRMENAKTPIAPSIAISMQAMLLMGKPDTWPDSIDTIIYADQVITRKDAE